MIGQYALRISGRSRSVAERSRSSLVKSDIDRRVFVTGIDERFVGDDPIGTIRPKFVRGAHGDVQPKSTLLCDDAGERLVFEVVEQPNIFGVSGNIGYFFGEKPPIVRIPDPTNARDSQP